MLEYIDINKIFPHEEIDYSNLEKIRTLVKKHQNQIFKPIIIDKNSYVVLDWHHRLEIAKELGFNQVPAILFDYFDDNLILETLNGLSKKDVIDKAKEKKLFPPKTTFHYLIKNWEKKHISEFF